MLLLAALLAVVPVPAPACDLADLEQTRNRLRVLGKHYRATLDRIASRHPSSLDLVPLLQRARGLEDQMFDFAERLPDYAVPPDVVELLRGKR